VAAQGARIVLCPTVVDLWEGPQTWGQVFRHQVRWARTVRVCRPVPYFFSILNNATLWPLLFMLASRQFWAVGLGCLVIAVRTLIGLYLQYRLTRSKAHVWYDFMVPLNDLLHTVVWALAFAGHTIEWRGIHYHVERSGKLTPR
jgi:ceramide glucosyltransferase